MNIILKINLLTPYQYFSFQLLYMHMNPHAKSRVWDNRQLKKKICLNATHVLSKTLNKTDFLWGHLESIDPKS